MNDKKKRPYQGVIVPMLTPFTANGNIDKISAGKLIRYLIEKGTIPFILGTTGEVYSIANEERDVLVRVLLENRREDIPLLVGMGGLTFNDTIRLSNHYFEWGIDAVVLTLPGYFQLNDDQVYHYFHELAKDIKGAIILYNIPATTHNSFSVEVVERLSRLENIIGIKDSEFDENRMVRSLDLWRKRDDFFYLIGVHETMPKGMALGASGVVPSTANLVPELYVEMFSLHLEGKYDEVEQVHARTNEVLSLYKNGHLLGESIAILKYLMSLNGLIKPMMLPPLSEPNQEEKKEILLKYEKIFKK